MSLSEPIRLTDISSELGPMPEKLSFSSSWLALVMQYPSESIIVARERALSPLTTVTVDSFALNPAGPKASVVCFPFRRRLFGSSSRKSWALIGHTSNPKRICVVILIGFLNLFLRYCETVF